MELYTSLTQLKMAMNGGQMPPMTPLTEEAKQYLDPALCLDGGMGGLVESESKGLQCPIRGCGKWSHSLALHLRHSHPTIPARKLRQVLGIPSTVALVSQRTRRQMSGEMTRRRREGIVKPQRSIGRITTQERRLAGSIRRDNAKTMGARNVLDACVAQLSHRMIDLENRLGRPVAYDDFVAAYGIAVMRRLEKTFGSWTSAKAQCGLSSVKKGMTPDDVCDALKEWYRAHGRLPSVNQAFSRTRTPLIPSYRTVLKVLGVSGWHEAMSYAAFVLGIDDPRYNPVKRSA
ncbi:MAG TPA: hypothetical protein VFS11_10270 [Gemmatimonadales bacterium]|nr:hypothetical protein [Gemmatimonadales bacterium]